MHVVMVSCAERHGVLVAHLDRKPARLREGDVVSVAGHFFTDQTRFGGDIAQMDLVANAPGTSDGEETFVDDGPGRDVRHV